MSCIFHANHLPYEGSPYQRNFQAGLTYRLSWTCWSNQFFVVWLNLWNSGFFSTNMLRWLHNRICHRQKVQHPEDPCQIWFPQVNIWECGWFSNSNLLFAHLKTSIVLQWLRIRPMLYEHFLLEITSQITPRCIRDQL